MAIFKDMFDKTLMKNNSRGYILTLFVLVLFLSLWNKGKHDLQEWDESRNGVNAYEMLQNKDYINFYYNHKLDTWNAKPPLMIWLITASYKVFGYNEFALRFPSTIATILFFLLCFYTIALLDSNLKAFLTCLILISTKAIFGNHVGLTGDFDALLVLFLTASVYTFILYIEKQKKHAVYLTALFIGLAFYTKGPASFVLVPGFILYALFRRKGKELFKDKHLWSSAAILLAIAASWFLLVYNYGQTATQSVYGSKNSIETLLIHDTYKRLTTPDFDHFGTTKRSFFFFFEVLDTRLNLWNYLFYLVVLLGVFYSFRKKKNILIFMRDSSSKMILLSLSLIAPLSFVLSISANQHDWYLAPIFMFVAFLTSTGIVTLSLKWKPLFGLTICLLIFTLSRQFYYINTQKTSVHDALSKNETLKDKEVFVVGHLKQDILLYLKWLNVRLLPEPNPLETTLQKGALILLNKDQMSDSLLNKINLIKEFEGYTLGTIKE